jgi:hypothetical protein
MVGAIRWVHDKRCAGLVVKTRATKDDLIRFDTNAIATMRIWAGIGKYFLDKRPRRIGSEKFLDEACIREGWPLLVKKRAYHRYIAVDRYGVPELGAARDQRPGIG